MTLKRFLGAGVFLFLVSGCGGADSTSGTTASTGLDLTIAASTAPFAHDDGASGQTARQVSAGVRSFTLFADNGAAWTLVDASPNTISVGYDDGASTTLGHLEPTDIVSGHYVKARIVQDWSKFDIDVALHDAATTTPGTLHAFQVTSDGALIDGTSRNAGYYEQDFEGGGQKHHYSGDDAIIPSDSTTAGAEAIVENGLCLLPGRRADRRDRGIASHRRQHGSGVSLGRHCRRRQSAGHLRHRAATL